MNSIFDKLEQSPTVALADKVRGLEAIGKKIIPLHTGDPDFSTHPVILEECNKFLRDGLTHYSNSRGLPELREAIASYNDNRYGSKINPGENILLTHGGIHAFYIAIKSILNVGEEVLVPDPTWISHVNIIKSCGGTPVEYALSEENGFLPDPDALVKLLTPKTRAIVINFPSNPLGVVADKILLKRILEFAEKNNLLVISDEVYDHIVFNGLSYSSTLSFPEFRDRVIVCQSFSKTFAMTGWRIGYMIAPKYIIDQALKMCQCTVTNIAPFIQKAALAGLMSNDVRKYVEEMRQEYERRADLVINLLGKHPDRKINTVKPGGAFYFFVDIRNMGWGDSIQTSIKILEDLSVAVVPGSAFGKQGEGYIRITFATSEANIMEGFQKLLSV
jgi:aspartate aminotransferase